ncbi:SPOR domain-containing protein [Actimicrobium antarcticum]|uniref:SPOR domain-containing protein n=1 Tax=Actimicrobium antarcticum TaxID=1051899 RepID=A0ABP7T4A4_9BURK
MLKFLFWLLLLINAVLFAVQRGALDAILPNAPEPQRMQQQITPEKILMMSVAVATPVTAAAPPVALVAPVAPVAVAAPVCVELGDFTEAEASRFDAGVSALALNAPMTRRRVVDTTSNIVYIPSLGDKESADRKLAELKRLGIKDLYILQTPGEFQYAISLGIFKSRAAAEFHLDEVSRQGVRTGRIGSRGKAKIAFQLRDVDEAAVAGVIELAATIGKVEQRNCAAK